MNEEQRVKVGVGVMILKDGKVLLGKRKGSHGAGEFAFSGGHIEFGESVKNCAKRETKEETGLEIKNIRFQFFGNLVIYENKHYAHIGVIADWESGEPKLMEPEKSEGWSWYDLDNLPEPLFYGAKMAIESYKNGKDFYDSDKD